MTGPSCRPHTALICRECRARPMPARASPAVGAGIVYGKVNIIVLLCSGVRGV
jgi:hypothetical protein